MNWRHLVVLLIVAVLFVAVIPLKNMLFESSGNVDSLPEVHSVSEYIPNMHVSPDVDRDHNGVEDGLDREITGRLGNGTAQEYVNVTVSARDEHMVRLDTTRRSNTIQTNINKLAARARSSRGMEFADRLERGLTLAFLYSGLNCLS